MRLRAWMAAAALALTALAGATAAGLAEPAFVDRAAALPAAQVYGGGWEHFVGGGVAIRDCNGDALPDLYAAGGANPASLFVNTSKPGGDITFAAAAVPEITDTVGAYPIDIDSDGHPDLAVLRVGGLRLLRGGPECSFTDMSQGWGLVDGNGWATSFSATWEPGQSWPTLAVGQYVDRDNPDGPFEACDVNLLYRPLPGGGYGAPIRLEPGFCALSMLFSDWRRLGRADLRISNDRHYYVRNGQEQMWRMDPLRLLGPEDGWPRQQLWGMGIASQDLTGDGLPEVMLTSMGDQMLMLNDAGGYRAAPWGTGSFATTPFTGGDGRPSTGWHAQFADVDNDGRADIFIAKGNVDQMPGMATRDPNNLLMGQPDGTFVEKADVAGVATMKRSRGAGLADLNGDGRLDLVVINRRAPMELWQNVTPDSGHWAAIDLRQDGANSRAVGAFVEVQAADGSLQQVQELTVGGGHASGQLVPLHFGLGNATTARVRVQWPDGGRSDWLPIATDRVTTLTRGAGDAAVPVR